MPVFLSQNFQLFYGFSFESHCDPLFAILHTITPSQMRYIPMRMGNLTGILWGFCSIAGTSPCVWGTIGLSPVSRISCRYIPMRMGNYNRSMAGLRQGNGTSPCVWGTNNYRLMIFLFFSFRQLYQSVTTRRISHTPR